MKPFVFLALFISGFFAASPGSVQAQPVPEESIKAAGKDFWLTVFNTTRVTEVIITGKHNASITFTYITNNTSQTYSLLAGQVLHIPLSTIQTNLITSTLIESVQNKSLHITSDSNIVVQYASWGGQTDDGTMIYPSDKQKYGDVYYLNGATYPPSGYVGNRGGSFSLVSTCDSLVLEITPAKPTAFHPALVPFTVQLHKGETYTIANSGSNLTKDLSGSKIEIKYASCCNPLNIFYTALCQYISWPYPSFGGGECCCDALMEQILPVSTWDTVYHVVPSLNNPYNIVKIVSSAAGNTVAFDGIPVATLGVGQVLDTIIDNPIIISARYPVGIMQFMVGMGVMFPSGVIPASVSPDSLSDPNSAWLLSMRDGLRETYFTTAGQSYQTPAGPEIYNKLHVLTLISKAGNIGTITLNNVPLASDFHPFPADPGYMYAEIRPDTGMVYHLVSQEKIIAYYYASVLTGSINFQLGDIEPPVFYDDMGTDTIVSCMTTVNVLDAGPADHHQWSTEASTQQIQAVDTGLYYVLNDNDDDCIAQLKRFVITRPPTYLDIFDLGNDTVKCLTEFVVLTGQGPRTEWSTGYTGEQIRVDTPGVYWARITDTCMGFSLSDTIRIMDTVCLDLYCSFQIPTAFSPNYDGLNDIFMPVYFGTINSYNLSIYNRMGQRVFNSAKVDRGWDGNHNNRPADVGVYFYYCSYYCPKRGYVTLKGEVTLIR